MTKDAPSTKAPTGEFGPQLTLLDELDARQNDVLAQLDELNHRIEVLLQEFTRQPEVEETPVTEKAA